MSVTRKDVEVAVVTAVVVAAVTWLSSTLYTQRVEVVIVPAKYVANDVGAGAFEGVVESLGEP